MISCGLEKVWVSKGAMAAGHMLLHGRGLGAPEAHVWRRPHSLVMVRNQRAAFWKDCFEACEVPACVVSLGSLHSRSHLGGAQGAVWVYPSSISVAVASFH